MKRTYALLLSVLILCVVFPSYARADAEAASQTPLTPVAQLVDGAGNVIFSDKVVEDAFRNVLGIPQGPITKAQLNRLGGNRTELIISSPEPITADLSVLQLCTNLKTLRLTKVTPANLQAIPAAKGLAFFWATEIQITDLRFLAGMKQLSDVMIGRCPCADISAVTQIPQLVNFNIDTYVPDITPLFSCRNLVSVSLPDLTDAQVNTLLDNMGGRLTGLGLLNSAITEQTLERIAGLKLNHLMLDNIPVQSIHPIWNIKTLQTVDLFKMKIDSLEGIQRLTKLKRISLLEITGLKDYSPLFQVTNLRALKISTMLSPDFQDVQALKNLEELTLDTLYGKIDLTPVFTLTNLRQLSLNNVRITTFEGIEGLTSLTDLSLFQIHGIQDYTPLSGLKKIQSVSTDIPGELPAGLPIN